MWLLILIKYICLFMAIGCKAFPKNSRNGRGRKQSGICFDWWDLLCHFFPCYTQDSFLFYACNTLYVVMLQMKLKALLLLEKLLCLVLNRQILLEYCHFCLRLNYFLISLNMSNIFLSQLQQLIFKLLMHLDICATGCQCTTNPDG